MICQPIEIGQEVFVDKTQCVAKWTELLVGLDESKHERMAWVLEEATRYLKSLSEEDRASKLGRDLRFVYPALRVATGALGSAEPTSTDIQRACAHATEWVSKNAAEADPMDSLSAERQTALTAFIAERVGAGLKTFPR
jgi:hypothetical protein